MSTLAAWQILVPLITAAVVTIIGAVATALINIRTHNAIGNVSNQVTAHDAWDKAAKQEIADIVSSYFIASSARQDRPPERRELP